MANLDTYRQQLVAEIEAIRIQSGSGVVIQYDNRDIVETTTQSGPFLDVSIEYIDGEQVDLSNKPVHRIVGLLVLTARVREGSGSAGAYDLLSNFYMKLHGRQVGDVKLAMSKFSRPKKVDGWWGVASFMPFHINQFPAS